MGATTHGRSAAFFRNFCQRTWDVNGVPFLCPWTPMWTPDRTFLNWTRPNLSKAALSLVVDTAQTIKNKAFNYTHTFNPHPTPPYSQPKKTRMRNIFRALLLAQSSFEGLFFAQKPFFYFPVWDVARAVFNGAMARVRIISSHGGNERNWGSRSARRLQLQQTQRKGICTTRQWKWWCIEHHPLLCPASGIPSPAATTHRSISSRPLPRSVTAPRRCRRALSRATP